MTTRPMASWRATTAPRWKTCFSTSRAGAATRHLPERLLREWPHHERASRQQDRRQSGDIGPSHRRDGDALLVSADVVLAAVARADLLAGAADHHLGFPAKLHLAECR